MYLFPHTVRLCPTPVARVDAQPLGECFICWVCYRLSIVDQRQRHCLCDSLLFSLWMPGVVMLLLMMMIVPGMPKHWIGVHVVDQDDDDKKKLAFECGTHCFICFLKNRLL